MKGKVDENNMNAIINDNLEMMDKILESRAVKVSEKAAMKSEEALITYINQSNYGKWVINNYAHLTDDEKLKFIKDINEVLPFVKNKEQFISYMKYSMKLEHCKTIAFECLIKDTMRIDDSPCILKEEGLEYFSKEYKNEIHKLFKNATEKTYEAQMKKQEE